MHLNRFIKYINYLIALALFAGCVAAYWYAYRPLPQTSGTVTVPGLGGKVTVRRDAQGVPHIEATSADDLFFAQGYVVAQDRLFQLELGRRQAAGELAELVGAAALESDLDARRLRLRRLADMHAASMPAADRAPIAAFARGINHYVETHRDRLPVEFRILGADPAPWTIADSVLVGLQMFRSMTTSYREELTKRSLLASGAEPAKVERLFPTRTGSEPLPGSNAWAISGRFTKSGKPLLASDPHLGFSVPSVWYQVHLKSPELNAAGVQLPGLPGVAIGHNGKIAWGITSLGFDVQDLYQEPPASAIRQEREVVRSSNGGTLADLSYSVTAHGPVIVNDGATPLALRWTAADPGSFAYPFVELNRASNWEEFRRALARHPGPGFNFVYADREGNIGLQVAGRLPVRRKSGGDVPHAPGAAADEWDGVIPFDQLPSVYNPPSGMVVSGNQNPFPANYPYRVSGGFAPHYRAKQIEAMLARGKAWEPEGMLRIQRDVYSPFSHLLAQQLAAAFRTRKATNPDLVEAVARLEKFNGQMAAESPEALLVTLAYQHLRKAVGQRAAPNLGATYDSGMSTAVLEGLLRERPADWFPDWDQLLVRVLLDAVEEGRRMQGVTFANWRYGAYNQLKMEQPVMSAIPWLGRRYYTIGPVPMSGSTTTVKQTTSRIGPSMRFVADLADWDRSLLNITLGQSGQALSGHRKDQWQRYLAGESLPMQFDKVDAAAATLELVAPPPGK